MKVLGNGKFVVRDGGDTWPTPMDGRGDFLGLEWRLRYGSDEGLVLREIGRASCRERVYI